MGRGFDSLSPSGGSSVAEHSNGFGFLMVARDPVRHTGVVLMGGVGKAVFALHLLYMDLKGWTSDFALVVIGGDVVFVAMFVAYFIRVRRHGHSLV